MTRKRNSIRVVIQWAVDDDQIAAYCRYTGMNPKRRREVLESMRATLEQVGTMGLEEQLHEGRQRIEYENEHGSEDGFALNQQWRNE